MRQLTYAEAINEAFHQAMDSNSRVIVMGQGVNNPWYVGTTAVGLHDKFGPRRVIDPPISENAMNGMAIGAALAGLRPVVIHPRLDFLMMGAEQVVNEAANWSYVFRGQASVPIVIRGIINRGGQQGAQHSQALQALFAHIPGLKVVMPASPMDAKGLLLAAIDDDNPVVYIDDRWLYDERGPVPSEDFRTPIGKARVARRGKDVTLAATSYMVKVSLDAAAALSSEGIEVEVVDLRTVKPLDRETLFESVKRTGRLVIADAGWRTVGIAGEVAATVGEHLFSELRAPIRRVTLPDAPAPSSPSEELAYYPDSQSVAATVRDVVHFESLALGR